MIDIIILVFAVIGFIVNAVKQSRSTPTSPSRPPSPSQPQSTQANAARQALPRTQSAARPGGAAVIAASNRPVAGAPMNSKIVSQAPMSGVAQQFAQERAAADRQMAAAADQARGGGDETAKIDNPFSEIRSASSRDSDNFTGSMASGTLNLRRFKGRDNVLNGLIFAQILTPPLCKKVQKPIQSIQSTKQKNSLKEA